MKILKNLFTLILVAGAAGFLVVSSFSFGASNAPVIAGHDVTQLEASIIALQKNTDGTRSLDISALPQWLKSPVTLAKGQAAYIEFGKLASAFALWDGSGTIAPNAYTLSGHELTIDPQYSAIFSLYDPFSVYTIRSSSRDFSLTQVTNGSFYIGTEADGTHSLYSIDAVVRLDFLSEWKEMTDMTLFPGMYIRFSPTMNSSLSWANLFRILQSLQPDGTHDQDGPDTTGIEFINPRMNNESDTDTFFMYKLPIRTNVLFQMLHILFYERVSQIDLYKEYGSSLASYTDDVGNNPWLLNPGKKSHFLLLSLDTVLANAFQNNGDLETFRNQITNIANNAKALGLGNDVQLRLEKFLTDGRFALFGGTRVSTKFSDIYTVVSESVDKAPVTAHAKLLQHLSDIYSKNLVAQKKDLSFSRIDTYTPTANELQNTLNSTDIEQRDYFDIALYTFNVLKKAEDKGLFIDEAVYAHPTYALIQTILVSTDRYVNTIQDPERKTITAQGIALHFYDHILSVLSKSVYETFMESDNGYLYLKETFRPTIAEPKIHMDGVLIRDLVDLDGTLSLILNRLSDQYSADPNNATFRSIKKDIALYHGFVKLLDYPEYKKYEERPYLHDDTSETLLPMIDAQDQILTGNPTDEIRINGELQTNPSVDAIVKLLGIPRTDIVQENGWYRVNRTTFQFLDSVTKKPVEIQVSLFFNMDATAFGQVVVEYKGKSIQVVTEKTKSSELSGLLWLIPTYISRYDALMAGNPWLEGSIRFFETNSKIIIGIYTFPLRP